MSSIRSIDEDIRLPVWFSKGLGGFFAQGYPDAFCLHIFSDCFQPVFPANAALFVAPKRRHIADLPVGIYVHYSRLDLF
jgi:hypothetical protein